MEKYPRSNFEEELKKTTPEEWCDESYQVAVENTYIGIQHQEEVSDEYIENNREIVEKQLVKAGYRLADFLIKHLPLIVNE